MVIEGFIAAFEFLGILKTICEVLGIQAPWGDENHENLLQEVKKSTTKISELELKLSEVVSNATVISITDSVFRWKQAQGEYSAKLKIDDTKIRNLIKLLYIIQNVQGKVVFALIFRDRFSNQNRVCAASGSSEHPITYLVQEIDRCLRSVQRSDKNITAFIAAKSRTSGTLEEECRRENTVISCLSCIVSEIFELPPVTELENIENPSFEPRGRISVALLRHKRIESNYSNEKMRRMFILGSTRSGKSTLANALVGYPYPYAFDVLEGMTGTLSIKSVDHIENLKGEMRTLQVIDTPGVSDKDNLDIYYRALLEDKIIEVMEASILVITVDGSQGINKLFHSSFELYKKLFGSKLKEMLYVIITLTEPADKKKCDDKIDLNTPSIIGATSEDVMAIQCISLHDLREKNDSYSHLCIKQLKEAAVSMDMKPIHVVEESLEKMKKSMSIHEERVLNEVYGVVDMHWKTYDGICEKFEKAPKKAICSAERSYDGFLYRADKFGKFYWVRESIILHFHSDPAKRLFESFYSRDFLSTQENELMQMFGDELKKEGFAVLIRFSDTKYKGQLKVRETKVIVFDPRVQAYERIKAYAQDLKKEHPEIPQHKWDMYGRLDI